MKLIIAAVGERAPGESRVALVPETAKKFAALGASLRLEKTAGSSSHFLDADYSEVEMVNGIAEAYAGAGLILRVTPPTLEEIAQIPEGSVLIGLLKPFENGWQVGGVDVFRLAFVGCQVEDVARELVLAFRRKLA